MCLKKIFFHPAKAGTSYVTSRIVMQAALGSREGSDIISPTVILTSSNTKAELQEIYNLRTISTQEEQFKTYLLYHFFLLFYNILSDCHKSDEINYLLNAFRLKTILRISCSVVGMRLNFIFIIKQGLFLEYICVFLWSTFVQKSFGCKPVWVVYLQQVKIFGFLRIQI